MYQLSVNDRMFDIKYAYTVTVKQELIPKIAKNQMQDNINSADDFFSSAQESLALLPETLLIGLQKYHYDEFGFNYDTNEGKQEALSKVNDLLDQLFDDEEVNPFDIYNSCISELMENGFLKKMFQTLTREIERLEQEENNKPKRIKKN